MKPGDHRAVVDLSSDNHAANHHEVTLVQLSFDFYMIEAKRENLIGDQAYDSDALDESLKEQGVEMIAPHRSNRRLKTQDGRTDAPWVGNGRSHARVHDHAGSSRRSRLRVRPCCFP